MSFQSDCYFKDLHIVNFRCFENLSLSFDKRITLLKGGKWSGRSTVCDALRILLCPIIYNFGCIDKFVGINGDDFRYDGYLQTLDDLKLESWFVFDKITYLLEKAKNIDTKRVKTSTTYKCIGEEIVKKNNQLINRVKGESDFRPSFPVLIFWDANNEVYSLEEKHKEVYQKNMLIPQKAYYGSLFRPQNFLMFRNWFYTTYSENVSIDLYNIKDIYLVKPTLNVLNDVLKKTYKRLFNKDAVEIKWKYGGFKEVDDFFVVNSLDSNGKVVSEREDEVSSMVLMVLDIVHRIIRLNAYNKDSFENILTEATGVVILDEFEKKPSNQFINMVSLLRELFPKVQFIVSCKDDCEIQADEEIGIVDLPKQG